MLSALLVLAAAVLAYGALNYFNGLRSHLAAARRSGLPYVVARKSLCAPPALNKLGRVTDPCLSYLTVQPLLAANVLDINAHNQNPTQILVGELDRVSLEREGGGVLHVHIRTTEHG